MKDSSGIMGDRSGFASGIVQIIITASGSNIGGTLGIDLLNTVDKNDINSILSKQKEDLSEGEYQMQELLKEINILPEISQTSEYNTKDIEKAVEFVEKLNKGSVAILQNRMVENDGVLLQAMDGDDLLLNSKLNPKSQL